MRPIGEEKVHSKLYKDGKLWVVMLIGLIAVGGATPTHKVAAKSAATTSVLTQRSADLGKAYGLSAPGSTSSVTAQQQKQSQTVTAPTADTNKTVTATSDDINEWMPDKDLQAIMVGELRENNNIDITSPSQITKQMMKELTWIAPTQDGPDLTMWRHVLNVKSLEGLQYATNLTSLDLSPDQNVNYVQTGSPLKNTQLSDISAIANLNKLTYVNLQMCNLHDISAFKNLTHIDSLSLSYNHITDISPLAKSGPGIYPMSPIGAQSYVMPTLHLNPATDSLTLSAKGIYNLDDDKVPVTPFDSQTEGDYDRIPQNDQNFASRYLSNATGSVLDENGNVIKKAGSTIKWTNLQNNGYLTYYWTDKFRGNSSYAYSGFVIIPYEKDATVGNVTVNYVDENGKNLGTTLLSGKLGTDYDVLSDQNVTQELADLKTRYGYTSDQIISGSQKGQYSAKGATVTIQLSNTKQVTETKTVKQTINYVDESGKALHDPATNALTFKRTNTVDANGKVVDYGQWTPASGSFKAVASPKIDGYTPDKANSDAVNDVTADSPDNVQTITYKKNPIATGSVVVNYVDENGKTLAPSVTLNGNVGAAYTTEQKKISGYSFEKMGSDSAAATGKFVDGRLTVTYVYKKNSLPVTGITVTSRYVDENGQQIASDKTINGKVGDPYQVAPIDIPGYQYAHLAANSAPATGQFIDGDLTVTFVYTKAPVAQGTVNVKYVDDSGNQIAPDKTLSGKVGDPYNVSPISIDNYQYAQLATGSAPVSGQFTDGSLTVTFVYTKTPAAQGTVNVKYVDDSGNQIAPDKTLSGKVGDPYNVSPISIDNYQYAHLAAGSAPVSGQFTDGSLTVTFVYTKTPAAQGTVDVKFVDDQGNQLAPDQTFSGKVGDPYTISPISIKDYQYAHLATNSAPATGTYTNGTITVTMVYTKTPIPQGSVNVKYVDDAGNTLVPDKVLTGQPGDPYEARPIDIANYQFSSLAPDSAPENGTFTTGTLTVTFVYHKNPAAQGTVNVHYVDENGNALAPDKVLTGTAGTAYTTAPATIAGYQYLRMAPNSAADSGTFTNGTLNVTFVYATTSTPVTPSTPTSPSTPNPPSNLPSTGGNNGSPTTTITPDEKANHTLPRTHEAQQIGLTALGVVLLALAGFLGVRWRRKTKN